MPIKRTLAMTDQSEKKKRRISPLSFMGSLFAGWFGVQSEANRQRDFEHGKFSHIIFAILFVLFVILIVQVVLSTAGS